MSVACPLCKSLTSVVISSRDRKKKPLETRCCQSCGLVFNSPMPREEELDRYYSHRYRRDYKGTYRPKIKHHYRYAERVMHQIERFPEAYARAACILDIGAGSGEFCALMKMAGKKVEAVEPTLHYASYVQEAFEVPVYAGSISNYLADHRFDFIRLNHVLEHMAQPVEILSLVRSLLTDDGIVHVEVPDFRLYCQIKSPGKIFHYGHIYNFDSATLIYVARKAGLQPVYQASSTSVYFKKGLAGFGPISAENAKKNMRAYEYHRLGAYTSTSQQSQKVLSKLLKAGEEQIQILRIGGVEGIFTRHAKNLHQLLDC